MMSIRTEEKEDVLVVYFNDGKILDDARIQQIGTDLLETSTRAVDGKLLVNFEGVTFMSSAMIGKLVLLHKKCKSTDVNLKLCNISPNVAEVFKIMRLNKVFEIYKDEEKALRSYEKRGWFS